MDYGGKEFGEQAQRWSDELGRLLEEYVAPLMKALDKVLDKRLVRTFLGLIEVIICFRGYANGLLLSELGGYLLSPSQAPAGTKRISNLLQGKWSYKLIERFLWSKGLQALKQLEQAKGWILLVWDESVWEKPESLALEGLGSVGSSQASRLIGIKPGFYHPPGKPIFGPGMNWLGVVVLGMSSKPYLLALRWWSNRGQYASDKATAVLKLLQRVKALGKRVVHVFDQGFAGAPWLERFEQQQMQFILRWPKDYKLSDFEGHTSAGTKKAWQLVRGQRSLDRGQLWDARRPCHFEAGLYYLQVKHPQNQQTYWLVVSRMGSGRTPWYLLTNQPITCHDDAWRVILAYARRWQIQLVWRFCKAELAFESPRLWKLSTGLKLLFIATLAFAFLLLLLQLPDQSLKSFLLDTFCHRTGKRCRMATTPLYRLRTALSRLWLEFPPTFSYSAINSG